MSKDIRIGTAGWSLPAAVASEFPTGGTHLERYACVFNAVEINTSFYRPHRRSTYERWAGCVPDGFRFAVKVPRSITHDARLQAADALLQKFLDEVDGLGPKLGPLLVQLPPSLPFETGRADLFLKDLRTRFGGQIACEPRHPSWLASDVERLLVDLRIGRVAADPSPVSGGGEPGGWSGLTYMRLHGSPRIYYSPYDDPVIEANLARLAARHREASECWCIFDNTAAFAATPNALTAKRMAEDGPVTI